jgi:hypothetical protein
MEYPPVTVVEAEVGKKRLTALVDELKKYAQET